MSQWKLTFNCQIFFLPSFIVSCFQHIIIIFFKSLFIDNRNGCETALHTWWLTSFPLFLLSGSHWSLMSVRVPAMSVFPPVRKDRVITQLPLVTGAVEKPRLESSRVYSLTPLLPSSSSVLQERGGSALEGGFWQQSEGRLSGAANRHRGVSESIHRMGGGLLVFVWSLIYTLPLFFLLHLADSKSPKWLWWATWLWGKPAWLIGELTRSGLASQQAPLKNKSSVQL